LDEPFLRAMMLALEWEGKWMPKILSMAELEGACKRIEKSILCLQEEKSKCADCRDAYSAFSRETLPRFLVEVQRLADADRNGRGMRAQSVTALCGELCNHISSIIKG
jgi:hypothetical protein